MERLPRHNWQYVKQNATVFLTNNISQDDPYTLYCGLHSGLNTIIVTRDFMRSHLYLLKDKHNKLLFNRWLKQSRYHLLHVAADNVFFKVCLTLLQNTPLEKKIQVICLLLPFNSRDNRSRYPEIQIMSILHRLCILISK